MKNNRLLYSLIGLVVLLLLGYTVAKKQGWVGKPTGVEVLVAHTGLRHMDGRVERRAVADAEASAVLADAAFVQAQHFPQCEKDRPGQC